MERISEKLEREKQELDKLYKKRDRIIETIRAKESKVQDYENQLRLEKYNSADHVLSMNGLSWMIYCSQFKIMTYQQFNL